MVVKQSDNSIDKLLDAIELVRRDALSAKVQIKEDLINDKIVCNPTGVNEFKSSFYSGIVLYCDQQTEYWQKLRETDELLGKI